MEHKTKPEKEHYLIPTDAGDMLKVYDYIYELEAYCVYLEEKMKQSDHFVDTNEMVDHISETSKMVEDESEKLAEDIYREFPANPKDKPDWQYNRDINCFRKRKAFVKGYNKAKEKYKYTEEDIKEAMSKIIGYAILFSDRTVWDKDIALIIQSLQQQNQQDL